MFFRLQFIYVMLIYLFPAVLRISWARHFSKSHEACYKATHVIEMKVNPLLKKLCCEISSNFLYFFLKLATNSMLFCLEQRAASTCPDFSQHRSSFEYSSPFRKRQEHEE